MAKSADAFRTISEVAEWLETPAHVLRFWESKFSQIKPVKRAGGRRYYRPADMQLLGGIKKLLHEDGMTIKGVQKVLRNHGIRHVAALSQPLDEVTEIEAGEMARDVPQDSIGHSGGTILDFQRGSGMATDADAPDAEQDPEPEPEASDPEDSDTGQTVHPDDDATGSDEDPSDPAPQPQPDPPLTGAEAPQIDPASSSDPAPSPEADAVVNPEAEPETEPEAESDPAPGPMPERALPSFMHRPAPPAETPGAEAEALSPPPPAPRIPQIDLPDDPADDIAAPPGALAALAACNRPISPDLATRLDALASRLRAIGQDRGA